MNWEYYPRLLYYICPVLLALPRKWLALVLLRQSFSGGYRAPWDALALLKGATDRKQKINYFHVFAFVFLFDRGPWNLRKAPKGPPPNG